MTVSIIGAGKIGTAIIRALKQKKTSWRIIGTGRSEETLRRVRELGVTATNNNTIAAKESDLLILSVKPYHLPAVVEAIKDEVRGKPVISVVAGVKTDLLEHVLKGARIIRAMPNINAVAGASVTALSQGITAREEDKLLAEEVFDTVGYTMWIPEEYMDAFTALIGSGPGFIAELVDALVLGAVAVGMPRELAYNAMLKLLKGTAKALEETGWHPAVLRDLVATPAGTTIEGIYVMELKAVKAALMKTIQQATRKSMKLGKEISEWLNKNMNNT